MGIDLAILASAAFALWWQIWRAEENTEEWEEEEVQTQISLSKIKPLAVAIAHAEGFYAEDPTNIPRSRHNPGDITGLDGKIKTYASDEEGWNALYSYLDKMLSGKHRAYKTSMTWLEVGTIYGGDPSGTWAKNVCYYLGAPTSQTLAEYVGA